MSAPFSEMPVDSEGYGMITLIETVTYQGKRK